MKCQRFILCSPTQISVLAFHPFSRNHSQLYNFFISFSWFLPTPFSLLPDGTAVTLDKSSWKDSLALPCFLICQLALVLPLQSTLKSIFTFLPSQVSRRRLSFPSTLIFGEQIDKFTSPLHPKPKMRNLLVLNKQMEFLPTFG